MLTLFWRMPSKLMPAAPLVICEYCDTVYRRAGIEPGEAALCAVCGGPLYRRSRLTREHLLALTIAALIVFVLANLFPIVVMESQGVTTESTLAGMVLATYDAGIGLVAGIAALTVFLFPLLQILLYLYVLVPRSATRRPRAFVVAMRLLRQLRPWSMVEVFLIGTLVSVVKMSNLADVKPQPGLFGFAALTALLTLLSTLDLRELWNADDAA